MLEDEHRGVEQLGKRMVSPAGHRLVALDQGRSTSTGPV